MPQSLFETFSLEFAAGLKPELKSHACRKSGELPQTVAHRHEKNLAITYRSIHEIEIAYARDEFRGEPLAPDSYGVTFRPNITVALKDGTVLLPTKPGQEALTRVTYHNLTKGDFQHLAFLRNREDRLLFIHGFQQADLLLRIATENLDADAALSAAAYGQAIHILEREQRISAEAAYAFAEYLTATIDRQGDSSGGQLAADFRRLDLSGEAALVLASELVAQKYARDQIELVLEEGARRLIAHKPRQYSLHLYAVLDFVTRQKLTAPQSAKLLWQTYLAAAAERAVDVLRKVFLAAKAMKADQETLEMIYKTWRGFAESDRRSGVKAVQSSRQLTGDSRRRELTVKEALDDSSGDAG